MLRLNWEYVNYLVKPHIENPSKRIANVSLTEDEDGIITLVVHFAPVAENIPPQKTPYAEGSIN